MSEYLPARRDPTPLHSRPPMRPATGSYRLRDWVASSLGRAVADVLPDVLRWAVRRQPAESRPVTSNFLPRTDGASGMTLSEVEVDIDSPFIRRVVIRSASSWTVAPSVIMAQEEKRRRGRFGLSALTVGVLGLAGVVLARRSGLALPSSVPVPAIVPRILPAFRADENPREGE
jgi:hypothetical protein